MRQRLPNRRMNETVELDFDGTTYAITVGLYPDGRPGEVFVHGSKVGSALDFLLDDASVLVSLLLQHGVAPRDLARSLGRGGVIAAVVGELVA
jgi:ribonucleoside-diphosphate reductase alpha chain